MQLGQQLASLKLEQSFIKELNDEDIYFAQKQYQKQYSQEMSKLSFKLQKIQRVKRNLQDIQHEESSKLKEKKQSLSKKYEFIQKNKQKYMTQKLKSYKIHHELWEDKITSIKRKNRDYMKAHADKSKKFTDQAEKFLKTKTQQLFSSSHNMATKQKRQVSLNRRSEKRNTIKIHTEGAERKSSIVVKKQQQLSRQNTQNHDLSQRKSHQRRETKTLRFTTEGHKQINPSKLSRDNMKNQSSTSNKFSIHSLKDIKDNQMESKKSIKMPYLDQNRFSHQLTSEQRMSRTHNNLGSKENLHNYKISIRNELLAEQSNFSFQKAMKKLQKIHKIKEINIKKLQPSQNALSPSKPRKPINAQQYRMLRAKSQVKKSKNKLDTQQNMQNKQSPTKDRFLGSRTIRNRTLGSQQRYHDARNLDDSRMSIAQSRMKQQEQRAKQISIAIESETKRWKKERIIKAIKDKIFKIKLEEMQKIKEKQLV